MTDSRFFWRRALVVAGLILSSLPAVAQTGDYIAAVVNRELVTAGELQQRLADGGVEGVLRDVCGLAPEHPLARLVLEAYS
jgi:hypothetical protein